MSFDLVLPQIPQTNLQLLAAMLQRGHTELQLRQVQDAYLLAANAVHQEFRGSGKPFICHLVGVAGLVLEENGSPEEIVAALLHSIYFNRIALPGAGNLYEKRALISQRFGTAVEQLVHHYLAHSDAEIPLSTKLDASVAKLMLADELEDASDYAPLLHGHAVAQKGNAASREAKFLAMRESVEQCVSHFGFYSSWARYKKLAADLQKLSPEDRIKLAAASTQAYSSYRVLASNVDA